MGERGARRQGGGSEERASEREGGREGVGEAERESEKVAEGRREDTRRTCAAEEARETTTTTGTVSENRIRGEQVTGGREPVRAAGGGVSSFSTPVLPRTAQSGA